MGDVNADGAFSIADAVLLQKWLLAVPDAELKNWKAADFNADNLLRCPRPLLDEACFACVKQPFSSHRNHL